MQSQFKRLASLVVTTFLLVQLFSPAVYAATPTPTATPTAPATPAYTPPAVKDCTVYEINATDRDKLWANTMGFLPTEINDLNQEDAIKNTQYGAVGTFQNPVTNSTALSGTAAGGSAFGGAAEASVVELAGLLSVDPVEMIKAVCKGSEACNKQYLDDEGKVNADAKIPLVWATVYAESVKKGGGDQLLSQLASLRNLGLLPGSGGFNLPTPTPIPYETMKIVLPGMEPGKNEYMLSDLFKSKEVNPDTCVIDSFIQGKVSYKAVLDEDLTYGTFSKQILSGDYVNPSLESADPEINAKNVQHFTTESLLVYLALNGGSNILIPSFYERWISEAKIINEQSIMIGLASGIIGFTAGSHATQFAKSKEKAIELSEKQANVFSRVLQGPGRQAQIPAAGSTAQFDPQKAKDSYNLLSDIADKQATQMITDNAARESAAQTWSTVGSAFNKLRPVAAGQVGAGLAMGVGWIGPARLVYALNAGLIIQALGKTNEQYLKVFANKEVAQKFRHGSSFFITGKIQEVLGKLTGGATAPNKAFQAGPLYLINYPNPSEQSTSHSFTHFQTINGTYYINTVWTGSSYAVNHEYLVGSEDAQFTSLPFMTNRILPKPSIDQRVSGDVYRVIGAIGVGLFIAKDLGRIMGSVFAIPAFLKATELAIEIKEPSEGGKLDCNKEELDKFINSYRDWGVTCPIIQNLATVAFNVVPLWTPLSHGGWLIAAQFLGVSTDIAANINLCLFMQMRWSSYGLEYVSNCKDSQYKVLAYQPFSEQKKKAAATDALTQKTAPVTDFLSQLNLGKAVAAASQSAGPDLSQTREILNLKLNLQSQKGFVKPSQIDYVHIDASAFAVNSRIWDTLKGEGCKDYRENYQSGDQTARLTRDGISFFDKQGDLKLKFDDYAWRLRSLGRLRSQEQGRVILPNKLIETKLDCGDSSFIEVDVKGSPKLTASPSSCNAAKCLVDQLEAITGRKVGTDLEKFIGRISSVDTSEGITAVSDGMIRFTRLRGGGLVGSETTAPSVDDYAAQGLSLDGSKLVVKGDGSVVLYGPTGGSGGVDGAPLGTLATIIGDRGKIEFDATDGRLLVFVYILATELASNVGDIQTRVVKNKLSDGTNVSAINLDAGEKTGTDSSFRNALAAIQGDGGMQSWEDENHLFYITNDPLTGKPILRVVDKNTGVATDYKITGDVTRNTDGSVTIPTEKGPFTFTFGKDAMGNPTLGVTGPDGLKEILALLAARGQNGIMTFNPSTGAISIYNGQDIPLSPEFAKNGISFTGDGNGNTRGIPEANLFGQSRVGASGSSQTSTQPINLPSWPSDVFLGILMLAGVLGLVLVIRRRTTFSY